MRNSQPWTWELLDHSISLHADLHRWLPATDPDGRDLVVSCGAALHHLVVALAAVGVRSAVRRLPNPDEPDRLASVELGPGRGGDDEVLAAAALGRRRTDRRRYRELPVPAETVTALQEAAAQQGALLRLLGGGGDRNRLLDDVRAAATAQAATPGYVGELARWNDGTRSGVDGAGVLVIGTSSDDRLAQLRAGEALSAVLVAATRAGLATGTLTQVLEVPATRRALRDGVLGGSVEPQVVLRVGWPPSGPALPATPRRPLSEVLTTRWRG